MLSKNGAFLARATNYAAFCFEYGYIRKIYFTIKADALLVV